MENSVIAKSGWLFRLGVDNKWIKNWVELYRDGYLKYYQSDYSPNAEDFIFMPTDCISIKTGNQVDGYVQPPEEHSAQCLFSVFGSGNKTWVFCGESLDDMRAWQLALEQARLLIIRSNYQPSLSSSSNSLTAFPTFCHPSLRFNLETHSDTNLNYFPPHSPYLPINSSLPYFHFLNCNSSSYLNSSHCPSMHISPYSNFSSNLYSNRIASQSTNYNILFGQSNNDLNSIPFHQSTMTSFIPSYSRSDGRDLSTSILAGPSVNSMLWCPYIWW